MKAAVVVFPGINRERDMARTLKLVSGSEPTMVWHADTALPAGTDLVVMPGGFSYGDYLRCGAIAARAPIMDAVRAHAGEGGLVLGVCNGFQILCESGLLPGVLMRNAQLKFICKDVYLRVERSDTPFTRGYNAGQVIRVPVAHGEGNYVADEETIARLEGEGRVLFRYVAPDGDARPGWNINGATNAIAGIVNDGGNVLGMMPHPENHVEASIGPTDGRGLFAGLRSILPKSPKRGERLTRFPSHRSERRCEREASWITASSLWLCWAGADCVRRSLLCAQSAIGRRDAAAAARRRRRRPRRRARPQALNRQPAAPPRRPRRASRRRFARPITPNCRRCSRRNFPDEYKELMELTRQRRNEGVSDDAAGQELFARFQEMMRPQAQIRRRRELADDRQARHQRDRAVPCARHRGHGFCLKVLGDDTPSASPVARQRAALMPLGTIYRFRPSSTGCRIQADRRAQPRRDERVRGGAAPRRAQVRGCAFRRLSSRGTEPASLA